MREQEKVGWERKRPRKSSRERKIKEERGGVKKTEEKFNNKEKRG